MSSLAEVPQGIPIPPDEIRSALESVAIPGFTGTLQLEIALKPEAAACVMFAVIRRQSKQVPQLGTTRQVLPDPERRKPVQSVIEDLKRRLYVRPVVTAIEVHVVDGVVQKITTIE